MTEYSGTYGDWVKVKEDGRAHFFLHRGVLWFLMACGGFTPGQLAKCDDPEQRCEECLTVLNRAGGLLGGAGKKMTTI